MNTTQDCVLFWNSTCSMIYLSMENDVLLYVAATVLVILTAFGNLLVIISICHFKQLHTPTNVLILSLAMADFLIGVFVMPVHLTTLIESCSLFESAFCSWYSTITLLLSFVSIYNILCIAVDRYFALSMPFEYSKRVSVNVAVILTTNVWIWSLLYNWALLYFNGNYTRKCPGRCLPSVSEEWSQVDLVLFFIFPFNAIVILYFRVFLIARRHAVVIRTTFKNRKRIDDQNNATSMASERKAARVLGILVSVFLICLIPYNVSMLLTNTLDESHGHVVDNTVTLVLANSTINPIIYALFYPWFRSSIKVILTFRICSSHSSHNILH